MKPRISLDGLLLKEGHSRMWFVLPTALAICLGLTGWWFVNRPHNPSRASEPFRIGFYVLQPFTDVAPDGSARGPAIEAITEAAQRRHIAIDWVYAPEGVESALPGGKVDLWSLVAHSRETHSWLTSRVYGRKSGSGIPALTSTMILRRTANASPR